MPSKNVGCIPLAVVMMTTANGMQPTFSGRHSKFFSGLYQVITEIAEVRTDIVRRVADWLRDVKDMYHLQRGGL